MTNLEWVCNLPQEAGFLIPTAPNMRVRVPPPPPSFTRNTFDLEPDEMDDGCKPSGLGLIPSGVSRFFGQGFFGRRAARTSNLSRKQLGVTASRVRFPSFPPIPRARLEGHESESRLAKGVRFQIALLGVQIPPDSPTLEQIVSSCTESWQSGLLRFVANEENVSSAGSNPADSSKTSQARVSR